MTNRETSLHALAELTELTEDNVRLLNGAIDSDNFNELNPLLTTTISMLTLQSSVIRNYAEQMMVMEDLLQIAIDKHVAK